MSRRMRSSMLMSRLKSWTSRRIAPALRWVPNWKPLDGATVVRGRLGTRWCGISVVNDSGALAMHSNLSGGGNNALTTILHY